MAGHKLRHKLPASAARRDCLTFPVDRNHPANGIFTIRKHIKDGIAFCTYAQCTGGINADPYINFSGNRLNRSSNAARFNHGGYRPGPDRSHRSVIQVIPDLIHSKLSRKLRPIRWFGFIVSHGGRRGKRCRAHTRTAPIKGSAPTGGGSFASLIPRTEPWRRRWPSPALRGAVPPTRRKRRAGPLILKAGGKINLPPAIGRCAANLRRKSAGALPRPYSDCPFIKDPPPTGGGSCVSLIIPRTEPWRRRWPSPGLRGGNPRSARSGRCSCRGTGS